MVELIHRYIRRVCEIKRKLLIGRPAKGAKRLIIVIVFVVGMASASEVLGWPYGAAPGGRTDDSLRKSGISEDESKIEAQTAPESRANPVKKGEERSWLLGMLELIVFTIQDLVQKYDQFENKDTDVLIETMLQTSSFIRKISRTDYPLNEARQKAVFFFIKGLAMKASRREAFAASRQYFERAVHEDSSFADARYQIARYHLQCTGDSAAAIEHLQKALEVEPKNGEVLRVLGIYYMFYPKDGSAKRTIEEAAKYLSPDDPRIPFYLGLVHDPYWSIVKPMNYWMMEFQQEHGREPGAGEVQDKRKELLDMIPSRHDSLKLAMTYYKQSMSLHPGYIRPVNAVVWALANDALRDSLVDSVRAVELRRHLNKMSTFVGYGLFDPRSFNTLALGFCAINDCANACEAWIRSMESLRYFELSPAHANDLKRENEKVSMICDCAPRLFDQTGWE